MATQVCTGKPFFIQDQTQSFDLETGSTYKHTTTHIYITCAWNIGYIILCYWGGILFWGCASGGVYVPCIYTHQVSYCRWLMSLLLYLCYVFQAPINSLVCWFCTSALGFVLFQVTCREKRKKRKKKKKLKVILSPSFPWVLQPGSKALTDLTK